MVINRVECGRSAATKARSKDLTRIGAKMIQNEISSSPERCHLIAPIPPYLISDCHNKAWELNSEVCMNMLGNTELNTQRNSIGDL